MAGRSASLVLIVTTAACGGGEGGPSADATVGPDALDISGAFDEPDDFDPIDCVPGSMAGLDPQGIWHEDVHLEFGSFAASTRIDGDAPSLTAILSGRFTEDVALTDDHLFIRLAYLANGDPRVRALYACAAPAAGRLFGKVAWCGNHVCYTGTFDMIRVERLPGEGVADGTTLVTEYAGPSAQPWPHTEGATDRITVNVRVVDGIAYVARYVDGLRIVDVSDPTQPVELGWAPTQLVNAHEIYNDVKIVDGPNGKRYALMASSDRGVVVIDVSDPMAPAERGTFPPPPNVFGGPTMNVHTIFTETREGVTRAYAADTILGGIHVYDVTDPEQPSKLGEWVHPEIGQGDGFVHDLFVEDGIAYLNSWGLGLEVVDANDPSDMVELGRYDAYPRRTNHSGWATTTTAGRRIYLSGDEDFTAHLHVVDDDPDSATYMQRIGELMLRPEVSIHNIMAFGDRAYVAWYQDGLRVIDLTDPTQPSVIAYYNTWDGRDGVSFYEGAIGLDVDLAQDLVYLADTARGLLILRVDR